MTDPGRSGERTALAWQRTACSLIAGAAVSARITAPTLGAASIALMAGAVVLAGWALLQSSGRYRRHRDPLGAPPDGSVPLALGLATACLGIMWFVAIAASLPGS